MGKAWKRIVTISTGFIAIVTAGKLLYENVHNLNPWWFFLIVSLGTLLWLGIDFCRQWAEGRITKATTAMEDQINNKLDHWKNQVNNEFLKLTKGFQNTNDIHDATIKNLKLQIEQGLKDLEQKLKTS